MTKTSLDIVIWLLFDDGCLGSEVLQVKYDARQGIR
jgi:hypothetical protein